MKSYLVACLKFFIFLGIVFKLLILNLHGLWSDEALQFWIAKGISCKDVISYAIINNPQDTSLAELVNNTHLAFLGSPAFTILLYFWSKISNSILWLRLLPCLFGIGILPLIYLIAREANFSKKWALAIVAFCSWNSPWFLYSIELRPYSLEIFFSALTLFLFLRILKDDGFLLKYYLWFIFAVLLGIISGYAYNLYFPFFIAFLVFYLIFKSRDRIIGRFCKLSVLFVPVFFLLVYATTARINLIKMFLLKGFYAPYLTYLNEYLKFGLVACLFLIFGQVIKVISWQLFNIRGAFVSGISLPVGIFFMILSSLFLVYAIYLVSSPGKNKINVVERCVISVCIYSIAVCVILSIKGLVPFTSTRHNLFFSPALFISFFICARQVYYFLNNRFKKIKENIFLFFLLVLLIMPNIVRNYQTANSPEIRELLMKIQHTVKKDDKVCVYMKNFDLPVFRYEYYYSNIPWIKSLKEEDIFTDLSFRAGKGNNYDYQWRIFSHAKLSGRKAMSKLREVKLRLSKEPGFIVDLEYSLPPKIFGIRASRLKQPNKG